MVDEVFDVGCERGRCVAMIYCVSDSLFSLVCTDTRCMYVCAICMVRWLEHQIRKTLPGTQLPAEVKSKDEHLPPQTTSPGAAAAATTTT